ncbi:MAG: ClpXP protease specificity-enhancing factor [Azovibrio sp.]
MNIAPPSSELPSIKPYLLRAVWEWCNDQGFTPYVAVHVDASCRVPQEFVRDEQIVLNIGMEATNKLELTNDAISFQARFGGVPREIYVPTARVVALYARENGVGMSFEVEEVKEVKAVPGEGPPDLPPDPPPAGGGRPHLQRIK